MLDVVIATVELSFSNKVEKLLFVYTLLIFEIDSKSITEKVL